MNITTSPYRPYSAIYKYSQPCLHYFHFFYNILYYTIYVYVFAIHYFVFISQLSHIIV